MRHGQKAPDKYGVYACVILLGDPPCDKNVKVKQRSWQKHEVLDEALSHPKSEIGDHYPVATAQRGFTLVNRKRNGRLA